jgi:hypothetical protein
MEKQDSELEEEEGPFCVLRLNVVREERKKNPIAYMKVTHGLYSGSSSLGFWPLVAL